MPRFPFIHPFGHKPLEPDEFYRPEFPSVAHLPDLAPADALQVLTALAFLVGSGQVDVYTASGSNDTCWNVDVLDLDHSTWQRTPLPEWAAQWLADHPKPLNQEGA